MVVQRVIAVDLAFVYASAAGKELVTTLAWGDEVKVEKVTSEHVEIALTRFDTQPDGSIKPTTVPGFIRPKKSSGVKPADVLAEKKDLRVLKVDFVDVQQGDAAVIETPGGKVILVDGGDNQMFARYLAGRFRGTKSSSPKSIDAIVVTHGDADHFSGLTEIHASETNKAAYKRLFIHPERVYHNGLVKRPSTRNKKSVPEKELLGPTKTVDGKLVLTGLESDLLGVPDTEMNLPFQQWKAALKAWKKDGPIKFRALKLGDDDAFDFLANEDIQVQVLGPLRTQVGQGDGLLFLGEPKRGPRVGHESLGLSTEGFKGASASHTINGHSILLRLGYGRFHFLLAGDLNDQAERILTRAHNDGTVSLRAEVLKVPHHGSADFSAAFLSAVAPIVSVVSSGDESARKEYIHPRATLMGALGKYSRIEEPLIFVTELVAFFNVEGATSPECHVMKDGVCVVDGSVARLDKKARKSFFAFSRAAFGIVKMRTDGERLMVYTNSGQASLKEAYAYRMDAAGTPVPDEVLQA